MGALGCFSPNHHQTTLEFSAICLHLAFQQFLKQTQEVFETFLCFLNLTASQIVHTSQALHSSLKIPGNQLKTHLLFHGDMYMLCIVPLPCSSGVLIQRLVSASESACIGTLVLQLDL